ncbi:MAG: hypothetical protein FWC97_08015 [Treponema sp.]|nr:hypothetical protein [Treponema sp.]
MLIVLVMVLTPLFITDTNDSMFGLVSSLRHISLPLLLIMILLLGFMGIFFFFNYRLLSLLEREDWPALAYYLEQKIYVKGRYNARFVKLLASSYLVTSDYRSVLQLESKTMLARPSLIDKNALIFGAARVLSGNHTEAAAFFNTRLEKNRNKTGSKTTWLNWFYGFSQLLAGNYAMAQPVFTSLANSSHDVVVVGISAYFLDTFIAKNSDTPEKHKADAKEARLSVVKSIKNPQEWNKEIFEIGGEVHVAIIRKYIDEAGEWLFSS